MARARTLSPQQLAQWSAGLNNVKDETALNKGELREAVNVDLTDRGTARRRPGFTQVYTGTGIHSLWRDSQRSKFTLFVEETNLKQLLSDNTAVTLRSGMTKGLKVSYTVLNRDIYYSNTAQSGMITRAGVAQVWWPEAPSSIAASNTSGGTLTAGTFILAASQVDDIGRESALTDAVFVTTDGTENITVTVPVSSYLTRVYMTSVDTGELFEAGEIPAGNTSLVITTDQNLGIQPFTIGLQAMPAGHIIRAYRGRMFSAVGSALYFSEPGLFGLHDPELSLFTFPERITLLEPVQDGLYVGTANETVFLQGDDPTTFKTEDIDPPGAVEGTSLVVRGSAFRLRRVSGDVAYWMTPEGPMLGAKGGQVFPYVSGKYDTGEYGEGSSVFLQKAGIEQILTTVKTPGAVSGLRASDSVTAEVRRNGVTIG